MFYNRIRLSSDKIIIIMLIKIFELFTKNTLKNFDSEWQFNERNKCL